jgi:hypothetical protein
LLFFERNVEEEIILCDRKMSIPLKSSLNIRTRNCSPFKFIQKREKGKNQKIYLSRRFVILAAKLRRFPGLYESVTQIRNPLKSWDMKTNFKPEKIGRVSDLAHLNPTQPEFGVNC